MINPKGVVIGPSGKIVTGGSFVAATRDVPQPVHGRRSLPSPGPRRHRHRRGADRLQGGDVVLIGEAATNRGRIAARNSMAALAAGNEVVLSAASGPAGVYVVPDPAAGGNVTDSRRIKAAAAELAAAGGDVYALAGNRQGLSRPKEADDRGAGLAHRPGRTGAFPAPSPRATRRGQGHRRGHDRRRRQHGGIRRHGPPARHRSKGGRCWSASRRRVGRTRRRAPASPTAR